MEKDEFSHSETERSLLDSFKNINSEQPTVIRLFLF